MNGALRFIQSIFSVNDALRTHMIYSFEKILVYIRQNMQIKISNKPQTFYLR
jgi:hypothetical protein